NGSGAFSPGNFANATIGRALGLFVKNIGGVRKGIEDMGVMGNPMKYTMVIAENEEESLWEPLHVELGYKKEDSTICLSFPQSFLQHVPAQTDAAGIIKSIMNNMPRAMRYTTVINPAYAKTLAREGFSKEKIKRYIAENKLVPASQAMRANLVIPDPEKPKTAQDDSVMVPAISDYRFIRLIVAGGPGAFIANILGGGPTPGQKEIQKIELPRNWDALVSRYKNVVPTYAKY
ncbi:MAG TPA: hypothetical protein VLH15_02725, partial [Dehalococcoidales bacterium]|nr:hypothetical protein [Dehalococcoidales bacterium]